MTPRPLGSDFSHKTASDAATIDRQRHEIAELRARLAEAQETLDAIRSGDVDAVVVGDGAGGQQIYTLEGADTPYRRLVEEMQEGALMLSDSGLVLYCNRTLASLLDRSAESLVGHTLESFVEPKQRAILADLIMEGGRREFTLMAADGSSVPVQLSFSDLLSLGGERIRCGIVADLTEPTRHAHEMAAAQARIAAEASIRDSEARYRLILESATDYAIIATDIHGRVTIWNAGARNVLGWGEAEILGRPVPPIWTPEDRAAGAAEEEMRKARETGRAEDERWHLRKDGTRFWANGLMMPLRAGDGATLVGYLKILRDRTAARQAEEQLQRLNETLETRVRQEVAERTQAQEQLRQAQKMEAVGQLTGGVAHDFNNLLTIIKSSTDLLRRPDLAEERRRRYVDAISDTVDRASKLTGQLLAFARRQALKPEVFDVGERVGSIADMLRTVAGARVRIDIETGTGPSFVRADISQFETALVNMTVNARDAMDDEGLLTVRVESLPALPGDRGAGKAGFVAVRIADTGAGIAADRLAQIFEPFYTTKEVGKGTGLGLSQVYGFAKQSGGDVQVRSEVGQGAEFTLCLPRIDNARAREAAADDPKLLAELEVGGGRRVLVVEDNVEVGTFSTQLLEDLGYETTWAATAKEALGLLSQGGAGQFDVVFSDIVMPGMSGVELGSELRRLYPALPVVLTSGYSHVLAEEGRHGFELLQKPYAVEELSRVLRRVMGRKRR